MSLWAQGLRRNSGQMTRKNSLDKSIEKISKRELTPYDFVNRAVPGIIKE